MAQPTLQASHEMTIGFRSNILRCALQALQHQSAVASLLLYSRVDFSLWVCVTGKLFFIFSFFSFSFFTTGYLQKKLFISAVFVLYNLCIRSVIDLRKKQSSSRLFKICADTPIFPPLPLYIWYHDGVHWGTVWKWLHVSVRLYVSFRYNSMSVEFSKVFDLLELFWLVSF